MGLTVCEILFVLYNVRTCVGLKWLDFHNFFCQKEPNDIPTQYSVLIRLPARDLKANRFLF